MSEDAELIVDYITGDVGSRSEGSNLNSGDLVVGGKEGGVVVVDDIPALDSGDDLRAKDTDSGVSGNTLGVEVRKTNQDWFEGVDVGGLRSENGEIREEEWKIFYEKLHAYVSVRVLRSGLREADLVQDITQIVAGNISRFLLDPKNKDFNPYSFSGWVARVTTNSIRRQFQIDRRYVGIPVSDLGENGEDVISGLPDLSTPEREVLHRSSGDLGSEIRSVLTSEQIKVLELLAGGNFDTQQEIADRLGVSLEVVKARLNRARVRLDKYARENPDSALGQYRNWVNKHKK